MKEDWKDALSALKNNIGLPEAPSEEITEDENSVSDIQKTPLLVMTDKKGRNGKIATLIEGFTIAQEKVEEIARKIKQSIGVGGSVRNGEILIQGDHKDKVIKILREMNFKTR